jgi:hypothetical protein
MAQEKKTTETISCPLARLFSEMEKGWGGKSTFFRHLHQSHVELLKAFRSLLDERIVELEQKAAAREKKRTTKIKVE